MKNNNLLQNKKSLALVIFAVIFGLFLGIFTKVYLVEALTLGDGSGTAIQVQDPLDLSAHKIENVATATASGDAVSRGYLKINALGNGTDGYIPKYSGGFLTAGSIYNDSDGDVGIGTTPGDYKLKVATNGSNNVSFGDDLDVGGKIVAGSATINGDTTITGGATIGGDINATGSATIGGDVEASSFFYTSDKRLKKNIQPLNGSLNKITDLQGVAFNWKDQNKTDKEQIGLIAQEVEKIYPEVVFTNPTNGKKSVGYGNLIAPLIESVKELKKINEKQEREIQAIQKKLEQSLK